MAGLLSTRKRRCRAVIFHQPLFPVSVPQLSANLQIRHGLHRNCNNVHDPSAQSPQLCAKRHVCVVYAIQGYCLSSHQFQNYHANKNKMEQIMKYALSKWTDVEAIFFFKKKSYWMALEIALPKRDIRYEIVFLKKIVKFQNV
jgi:hypothetical protein